MKKSKFLFGITALLATVALMGCDMELRDEDERATIKGSDGYSIASVDTEEILNWKVNGSYTAKEGFTIEFTGKYASDASDWQCIILSDSTNGKIGAFHLTSPNIDAWGSSIGNYNGMPGNGNFVGVFSDVATEAGAAYNFMFTGNAEQIKITVDSKNGINYYFNNVLYLTYEPDDEGVMEKIIGIWCDAINNGTAMLHCGTSADKFTMTNFIITKGVN